MNGMRRLLNLTSVFSSSGFRTWDCTNLASVLEVLSHSAPSWGYVAVAGP